MKTTNQSNEERARLMSELQKGFATGLNRTEMAKQWLADRKLSAEVSQAGHNSGQLHQKRLKEFIPELEAIGYLIPYSLPDKNGKNFHKAFGRNGLMFPLRNENGQIVNFCSIKMKSGSMATFLNNDGLYPAYPDASTKKLFIVQGIIEAATLLEAKVLKEGEAVIALFDGKSLPQHKAIGDALPLLEEVIEIGVGDTPYNNTNQITDSHGK